MRDPEATKAELVTHLREVHRFKNLDNPHRWTKAAMVEAHRAAHAREGVK